MGGRNLNFPTRRHFLGAHPTLWMRGVRHREWKLTATCWSGALGAAVCLELIIHRCLWRPCALQAVCPVCRHKQPAEFPPLTNRLASKEVIQQASPRRCTLCCSREGRSSSSNIWIQRTVVHTVSQEKISLFQPPSPILAKLPYLSEPPLHHP